MKEFKKLNNIAGWSVFGIAFIVYFLTVEPTASLWDCGEFIAAAYKLEIGHPPGAPIFMLVGRFFSLFAPDTASVAFMVNMVSVVTSAFTILFLFWTIVLLAKKMVPFDEETGPDLTQKLMIFGSAAIGALAFTFSDSFWFSAVEAEVYAFSSFFTAFVFWAILKWETIADKPGADRWLILIGYMIGLSIGVHLLNLLAIPALGFVYYFRKAKKPSIPGVIAAFFVSVFILGLIQSGVITGLPSIAKWMELKFVNEMGLPFKSGLIVFFIIFIGAMAFGIWWTHKKGKALLNTAILSLTFIIIGYMSYAIIVIRSQYKPPLNENDPGKDVMTLVSFLKREQYGDWYIFSGYQFGAPYKGGKKGDPVYRKGTSKYIIIDNKTEQEWDESYFTYFPRMSRKEKTNDYVQWLESNTTWQRNPNPGRGQSPYPMVTMGQNMKYMFQVQMNNMYWRYFFWNFVGRSGDIKGYIPGSTQDADAMWLGEDEVPSNERSLAKNQYFALPFLLGLAGMLFHFSRRRKDALVVLTLFFFTGLAIILYLNAPPLEPRERDYAYAGSYYAFAVWIGLGVLPLVEGLKRAKLPTKQAVIASLCISLVVPGIMVQQNWDDHDRSERYFGLDSAKNLLDSCPKPKKGEKGAILFTAGDNDTFPLWYAQEVEGYRTDVRVCNLSLLNTTWYIDQMKLRAYESDSLPIRLHNHNYCKETFNAVNIPAQYRDPINPNKNEYTRDVTMDADVFIELIKKNHKSILTKNRNYGSGKDAIVYLPANKMRIKVDPEVVKNLDWVPEKYKDNANGYMEWSLGSRSLDKKSIIMTDMISNINKDGWNRPIYFSTTMGSSNFLGLQEYMQLEGFAYRLLPVKTGEPKEPGSNMPGATDTKQMYDRLMATTWRGMQDQDIFYDVPHKIFPTNVRHLGLRLARELYQEDSVGKARNVMKFLMDNISDKAVPYYRSSPYFCQTLFLLAEKDSNYTLAFEFADQMMKTAEKDLPIYIKRYEERLAEFFEERMGASASLTGPSVVNLQEWFQQNYQSMNPRTIDPTNFDGIQIWYETMRICDRAAQRTEDAKRKADYRAKILKHYEQMRSILIQQGKLPNMEEPAADTVVPDLSPEDGPTIDLPGETIDSIPADSNDPPLG